jgi:uncharacterized Zn finger protein (UPF0148 family)
MIKYALVCERKHNFEVWFSDSADYDRQRKRGLVTCPVCDSKKVEKAIMAPAISRGTKNAPIEAPSAVAEQVAMISPQEQEFRLCRREVPGRGAQDALRRDRTSLDLRRRLAAGSQGTPRGRHRVSSAARPARRVELTGRAQAQ